MLQAVFTDLAAVAAEQGPTELSPAYVAYYRDQARRLDDIEQRVNRIRAALQPIERRSRFGLQIPPPSLRTTWGIIYAVLAFLGAISLLFFLRWYGGPREQPPGTGR
jgi:hypothetical protein